MAILHWKQGCYVMILYHSSNSPNYEERTEALAIALARIFWRAGEKRKAVVCMYVRILLNSQCVMN